MPPTSDALTMLSNNQGLFWVYKHSYGRSTLKALSCLPKRSAPNCKRIKVYFFPDNFFEIVPTNCCWYLNWYKYSYDLQLSILYFLFCCMPLVSFRLLQYFISRLWYYNFNIAFEFFSLNLPLPSKSTSRLFSLM